MESPALATAAWQGRRGRAAGERAVRAIAIRDTLDITSFPGHGNEAACACVHERSFAFAPPTHNYHAYGVGGGGG